MMTRYKVQTKNFGFLSLQIFRELSFPFILIFDVYGKINNRGIRTFLL